MILKYFKGIVRSEYIYISILNNRILSFSRWSFDSVRSRGERRIIETNVESRNCAGTNFGSIKDQIGQWKPPEWLTRKNESLRNSRWARQRRKKIESGWFCPNSRERERERARRRESRSRQNWVELQSSRALTYTVGQGLLSANLSFFFTHQRSSHSFCQPTRSFIFLLCTPSTRPLLIIQPGPTLTPAFSTDNKNFTRRVPPRRRKKGNRVILDLKFHNFFPLKSFERKRYITFLITFLSSAERRVNPPFF